MLDLAVVTKEETLGRMRPPLEERGIRACFLQARERAFPLDAPPPEFEEFDVGFVYPTRLMEGGVVDVLLGVPWVNDAAAVLTSRNKGGVIARLAQAGLPILETVMVSNLADLDDLQWAYEQIGPPVVVKPNSATRGTGVARAEDLDSFLGICDYLELLHGYPATGDRSFLVQEYLPGGRDYRAMVIDGAYAGAVERRLPDEEVAAGRWKHNVHRNAEAVGLELPGELRELAERTADALGIDYLGVDFLVTEERAVITETNARPTIDDEDKYEPGFYDDLAALIRSRAE